MPKRLCIFLTCCFALVAGSPLLAADDATMTDAERADLLELLDQSRQQYLGLLASASDAQWNWKPSETRWSVGECAEHILRSNESMFGTVRKALAAPPNAEWRTATQGKTQFILSVMPNRRPMGAGGATAPMEIRPTGEGTRQSIVERFNALYDEIEQWAATSDAPLKAHTREHPFPVFGTLNAYQWAIYVPLHTIRHSRQMVEVMETEGYPDS